MKLNRPLVRRFRLVWMLKASLVVGALYDLGFAAQMIFIPELASRLMKLPLPAERFYLWLIAVFLTMLALLYLETARDPRRYSAVIVMAIFGRTAGAVVFALAAWGHPELATLWWLAGADLAFALVHAACWLPLRA